MEVHQLKTVIDASGRLHLDIPTQLTPGEVNVVLVLSAIDSEKLQQPNYDFSDLAGNLSWLGDAVEMQRAIRDEGNSPN
jgi:hypothetical protein